jgi:hypothetical protein
MQISFSQINFRNIKSFESLTECRILENEGKMIWCPNEMPARVMCIWSIIAAMAGPSHAAVNNCLTQNMTERALRHRKAVTRPETRMSRAAAL